MLSQLTFNLTADKKNEIWHHSPPPTPRPNNPWRLVGLLSRQGAGYMMEYKNNAKNSLLELVQNR